MGTQWLLVLALTPAPTIARPRITTEADLPRSTYAVPGTATELLTSDPATFAKFAAPVGADVEHILSTYQIDDHATMRKLLGVRLDLQILAGGPQDHDALTTIAQIRALEDKSVEKLTSHLREEAFLKARLDIPAPMLGSCPARYPVLLRSALEALPWEKVSTALTSEKGFVEIASTSFYAGFAENDLGEAIKRDRVVNLTGAEELISARAEINVILVCKAPSVEALSAYVAKHKVIKPEIWSSREAVLPARLTPVNVGIWDSGFDTALFPGKLYTSAAVSGDDPHGIAFDLELHPTHGELIPLSRQQIADYHSLVSSMEGLGDLQNGIDSPAASAFKQKLAGFNPQQMNAFIDELEAVSGYAHGTHVTGIAARGNPAIRLAYSRMTFDLANPHIPPTEDLVGRYPAYYAASVAWFRGHDIRVVNMSWWERPSNFEKDLADNGIGKDAAERKQLARHYFEIERDAMLAALKSAPEILFVTIAGNNNADNAFEECIPSSFKLPNLLVTGAVDQAGDETGFTSYGDNVFIHADGYGIESVVPGGSRVKMSGTSMSAPEVTNLAAKLLAIDPHLTPPEVIALIRDGSDASSDGRRHLLNPKRSVELLQARRQGQ